MKKQLFLLMCLVLAATPLLASEQLDEANASFTYQGKPIHPGLVQEFNSLISDPGLPTTITVDVAAPHGNEYSADINVRGKNICINTEDRMGNKDGGSFCYEWLGRLGNGFHVLRISDSGGGSGVFMDLFLVRFDQGVGYARDGKKYERLLMSIVRQYPLGDRSESEVEVLQDKVLIHPSPTQRGGGFIEKDVELKFPPEK